MQQPSDSSVTSVRLWSDWSGWGCIAKHLIHIQSRITYESALRLIWKKIRCVQTVIIKQIVYGQKVNLQQHLKAFDDCFRLPQVLHGVFRSAQLQRTKSRAAHPRKPAKQICKDRNFNWNLKCNNLWLCNLDPLYLLRLDAFDCECTLFSAIQKLDVLRAVHS